MARVLGLTGDNGIFLSKFESKHGTYYSTNLDYKNGGKDYVNVNIGTDGKLTGLRYDGETYPLSPTKRDDIYITSMGKNTAFVKTLTTKDGREVAVIDVVPPKEEAASNSKGNSGGQKQYNKRFGS